MMSGAKKRVPKRRFKEFLNAGDWEQRKLGDLLILLKDGSHGTHKNTDEGVYLLSAKNIKNGQINIMPDDRIISWEDYDVIHKNYELQFGDILLTIVGSIGETAIYNLKTKVTFQRSVAFLRPSSDLNNGFLYTLINTDRFQNQLQTKQVVSAQPGIYLGDLASIDITYPKNLSEQEKIYSIFKEIENSITLHQRKLDKLQATKKALLQEMFPEEGQDKPKRRFKGFTDAWEQRKLTDIAKTFIGLVTTMTENYRDSGTLLIRNSDIKEGQFIFSEKPIHLDEEFAEKNKTRRLQIGDVVTVHTGDIGTSAVIQEKEAGAIGFATINTRTDKRILNPYFLSTYFNTEKHKCYANSVSTGDGRSNYNIKDFNKLVISIPTLDEQEKISAVINIINTIITLHQRKLDKLKNLKQAYLNEMFV